MTISLKEKLDLRFFLGKEKLALAGIMLSRGKYNETIINSYLSLFYTVRSLLINNEEDSDDPEKILDLAEKYFEPSGWNGIDIMSVYKKTKDVSEIIGSEPAITIDPETAAHFYKNALSVLDEIAGTMGYNDQA